MMNTKSYSAAASKILENWEREKYQSLREITISKVKEAQYTDENITKLVAAQNILKEAAIDVLPIGQQAPRLEYVEDNINKFISEETKKIIHQLDRGFESDRQLVRQTVTDILNSVELCDTYEQAINTLFTYGVVDEHGKIIHTAE